MADQDCKTCSYFWIQSNAQMGSCRRYPTYQNRHSTEWCGEFSALKHYDLSDTIENLVSEAEKQESYGSSSITNPAFIAEQKEFTEALRNLVDQPKNKGGRPRKVSRI